MRFLVTGASGFVGKRFVKRLLDKYGTKENSFVFLVGKNNTINLGGYKEKIRTRIASVDIRNIEDLEEYFCSVDCVVHLAARVEYNKRNKDSFYEINVDGTKNVFDASLRKGIKKIVYLSSAAALHPQPQGENFITENVDKEKIKHVTHYSRSKYLACDLVEQYRKKDLNIVCVMPSSVFSFDAPLFRPLFEICSRCGVCFLPRKGGRLSYVTVDNLVDFTMLCLRSEVSNETYLLSDCDLDLSSLMKKFSHYSKKKCLIIRIPNLILGLVLKFKELTIDLFCSRSFFNYELYKFISRNFLVKSSENVKKTGFKFRGFHDEIRKAGDKYKK